MDPFIYVLNACLNEFANICFFRQSSCGARIAYEKRNRFNAEKYKTQQARHELI